VFEEFIITRDGMSGFGRATKKLLRID